MALKPSDKTKYKIWMLNDEIKEVSHIEFSPCTSQVGLLSLDRKFLRVLQIDFSLLHFQEIYYYHCDFEIEDIKWSPDCSSLLLVSLRDCQFLVVNCFDPESTFRVQDPNTVCLASVLWVPDSKQLISTSTSNIFSFAHSSLDGKRILLPSISCANVCKPLFAFSEDGKYAASVTFFKSAHHINLMLTATWNVLWMRPCNLPTIQGLQWSHNSSVLAVWNSDKQVSFFGLDGENIKQLLYDDLYSSGFLIGIFSPNDDLFVATCMQDEVHKVLVYNLVTWQLCAVLNDTKQPRNLVAEPSLLQTNLAGSQLGFSQCGNLLAAFKSKGLIMIWNLREGLEPCMELDTQTSFIGLKWHPKKTQIAALTSSGTVLVWKYSHDGPIDKREKLYCIDTKVTEAGILFWSKSNLIISPSRGMQKLVVLIKKKRAKKAK